MSMSPIDRVRVWKEHAQHPQRRELAEAVIDLDNRLRWLEQWSGGVASMEMVEALRQQLGRVAEGVPHAWVLVDALDPGKPIFIDVFATPEAGRRGAEVHHNGIVQWPDAIEATAQTGYVHPPGEGGRRAPRYRLERRPLRGA